MVQHIVTNLLSNAIRYTQRGYVTMRSCVDNRGVCIEVEDSGIGIGQEDQMHVFDDYFRGCAGRKEWDLASVGDRPAHGVALGRIAVAWKAKSVGKYVHAYVAASSARVPSQFDVGRTRVSFQIESTLSKWATSNDRYRGRRHGARAGGCAK